VKGNLGEEFAQFEMNEDESMDENPVHKAFASSGLNTNKQLKNYDCWEEEKTPA
jgi:dynein heavy chain